MEWLVNRAILRYLKRHYPRNMKRIIARAAKIRPVLAAKGPCFNVKENALAGNINVFILFLSYHEATNHKMGGEAIDEIIDDLYRRLSFLGKVMNINNPLVLSVLRKLLYSSYQKYADKVSEKRKHGEWFDTWGMIVDPDNESAGFAFTLVGCPLVEYAKKYGYMELVPHMCALDHTYAKLIHAKLIRTHTVAEGADSCDYRYVPDKSRTARDYNGRIV